MLISLLRYRHRHSQSVTRGNAANQRILGLYVCAIVSASISLIGCGLNGSAYGGLSRAPSGPRTAPYRIHSEIVSGTREEDGFGETVNISVQVDGHGEPLGYFKSSLLDISSGPYSFSATAEDTWLNFAPIEDGWPTKYLVTAEYDEYLSASGSVIVTVKVGDFMHDSYGTEIYRETHDLVWE